MSTPKLVFLHGLTPPILEWVVAQVPDDFGMTVVAGNLPAETIARSVSDADFLMIYRAELPDEVLRAAAQVRLIQLLAAGYEQMNLPLMRQLNIPCAQNAGANSGSVADHAVLLMLALYRRLLLTDRATREGRWREPVSGLNTFEMEGKLVGLVGFGHIGRKVARRVQGFGARVQCFSRSAASRVREAEAGVSVVPIDELFRTSDIVSLHVPLAAETRNLVDATVLATMKPTAVLVNTSRGEIIDEAALLAALTEGRLAGAGLDVFQKEPVAPTNPLLRLDNVVVTSHIAGTTRDAWSRRLAFAFDNMRRVWAGEAPLARV